MEESACRGSVEKTRKHSARIAWSQDNGVPLLVCVCVCVCSYVSQLISIQEGGVCSLFVLRTLHKRRFYPANTSSH